MKSCPQCESIDVPDKAEQCPFCGYSFIEEKEESENIGLSIDESEDSIGFNQELVSEPQSLGEFSSNSTNQRDEQLPIFKDENSQNTVITKKKNHGFRNFLVTVGIAIAVYFMFMDNPSDLEDKQGNISMNEEEQLQENIVSSDEDINENQQIDENEPLDEREILLSQIQYADQYILPFSNVMYLERSDLEGLTPEQLRIARNELYARHGRLFQDEALQAYFNNCQWYIGRISGEDFTEEIFFNEYEIKNRDFIRAYEHELDVNGQ